MAHPDVFMAVNLPCILTWAGAGTFLGSGRSPLWMNRLLGALLVGTAVAIVI